MCSDFLIGRSGKCRLCDNPEHHSQESTRHRRRRQIEDRSRQFLLSPLLRDLPLSERPDLFHLRCGPGCRTPLHAALVPAQGSTHTPVGAGSSRLPAARPCITPACHSEKGYAPSGRPGPPRRPSQRADVPLSIEAPPQQGRTLPAEGSPLLGARKDPRAGDLGRGARRPLLPGPRSSPDQPIHVVADVSAGE